MTTTKRRPLTKEQTKILRFFCEYTAAHGYAPTISEIAADRGRSKVATWEIVRALIHSGYLEQYQAHRARSITLTAKAQMVGTVPASAQCLTCEEFVTAPHLTVGLWVDVPVNEGKFESRTITIDCPHCGRTSHVHQRREC